jgi:general secretion pathway protein K
MNRAGQHRRFAAGARGSALIVMYWIIGLLSLLVFGGAQLLFSEFAMQSLQGQRARANQLAEMGLAIAAHPQIQRGDPALIQQLTSNESFSATIESENARLNLNALLQNRDSPVLQRLFELWGMRPEEATPVISSLLDWVDPDDLVSLDGAEEEEYRRAGIMGAPPNRRLLSLGEAHGVLGMEVLASYRPDWEDFFTLFGSGKLALDDASPEAISAACGCDLESAQELVELRRGRDGLENTEDDEVFQSVDQVLDLLKVPAPERAAVAARVTLQGSTLRLRSEGRMEDMRVERWLVVEGRGPGMRVLAAGSRTLPSKRKR